MLQHLDRGLFLFLCGNEGGREESGGCKNGNVKCLFLQEMPKKTVEGSVKVNPLRRTIQESTVTWFGHAEKRD